MSGTRTSTSRARTSRSAPTPSGLRAASQSKNDDSNYSVIFGPDNGQRGFFAYDTEEGGTAEGDLDITTTPVEAPTLFQVNQDEDIVASLLPDPALFGATPADGAMRYRLEAEENAGIELDVATPFTGTALELRLLDYDDTDDTNRTIELGSDPFVLDSLDLSTQRALDLDGVSIDAQSFVSMISGTLGESAGHMTFSGSNSITGSTIFLLAGADNLFNLDATGEGFQLAKVRFDDAVRARSRSRSTTGGTARPRPACSSNRTRPSIAQRCWAEGSR